MNHLHKTFLIIVLIISPVILFSQVSADYAVLVKASVDTITPKITLSWPSSNTATSYTLNRKTKIATSWGATIATLTGTDSNFVDLNVLLDTAYEYRIIRNAPSITAYGYIYAGIRLPADHNKGKLIMIVDSTYADSLSFELHRLMKDISGDGWALTRYNVSPLDSVPNIKSIIVNEYNADPANVKAVLLFGHVPVPYSGDNNPDGHPDHKGAWPADVYYADVNGVFTDTYVNDTVASRIQNRNIPGDGKFDQTVIPTTVELQIGRIDMFDLPSFPENEKDLLRRYLNKDHAFRQKITTIQNRALIDDNFGAFGGEAFAASGWKSFSPLVGNTTISEIDFLTTLQVNDYKWAYGCGGGWYQGAGGIGSSTDFASDTVKAIFTMLFGSYFGDWDSQDNFMRSCIAAKGNTLTCCWSGRPHWNFHHMGLGENIGYSTKLAQNNTSTYFVNYGGHYVHIELLGDPTLKSDIVSPPSALTLTTVASGVTLNWSPSSDTIVGYHVYRSNEEFGMYERITSNTITSTQYLDGVPLNGTNYYMVRAMKLEQTPSGSYFNLSEGISDSIYFSFTSIEQLKNKDLNVFIFPNPANKKINLRILSKQNEPISVNIYDVYGRFVLNKIAPTISEDFILPIELNALVNGVYLIEIKSNKLKLVKRFEVIN